MQSNEVTSSNVMERKGLERGLAKLRVGIGGGTSYHRPACPRCQVGARELPRDWPPIWCVAYGQRWVVHDDTSFKGNCQIDISYFLTLYRNIWCVFFILVWSFLSIIQVFRRRWQHYPGWRTVMQPRCGRGQLWIMYTGVRHQHQMEMGR